MAEAEITHVLNFLHMTSNFVVVVMFYVENTAGIWCSTVYSKFQHPRKLGGQLHACCFPGKRILTLCWFGGSVVPGICLDEIKRYFPALNINQNPVTLLTEGCK